MARAIPTYQRQNLAGGTQSAPSASSSVSANDPVASALGNLGQAVGGAANTLADEAIRFAAEGRKKLENEATVVVSNSLSEGDVYWQQDSTERMKNWKVGDPDLRDGIGKDFDKWAADNEAKLPTEAARNYFRKNVPAMKARLQTNAFTFQERATTGKLNADSDAGMQADENTVYNEPKRFDEIYKRRVEPLLARTDLTEAEKIKAADVYKRKLNLAVERGEMQRDPVGWYTSRFGSTASPVPAAGAPGAVAGPTISTAAGDVPSALWSAQIRQESGGKQLKADGTPVTSTKGAIGIAQVMPGTAPEAARLAGLPFDEQKYRTDAAYNEKLGQAYMAQQLKTFGGDQAKALAAYNMGPGSADKGNGVAGLVAKHGDKWLAYAPAETQNYVKVILGNAGKTGGTATAGATTAGGPVDTASSVRPGPIETAPQSFRGMDWEQQDALRSMAETRMRQDTAKLQTEVDMRVRDATAMHADGKVDPFNMDQATFDRAYGADGGRRFQDYQSGRVMAADIGSYMTMSPAQIEASLQENQGKVNEVSVAGGAGYAAADARQQLRIRSAQAVVKMQQDDPQAYAVKAGLSTAKPLDMGDPQKFGVELAGRAATAAMLRDTYKAPFTLLMKGEAASLSAGFNKMTSDQKLAYLGTIAKSVTDPVALASVFQQIAPDSPVTAVAGKLMTLTGSSPMGAGMFSSGTTYNPQTVATMIIQGEAILNPSRAAKKEDGKPVNMVMPKEQDLRGPFNNAIGKAFTNQGDSADVAYASVKAYYAAKMVQLGDYSGDFNSKAMKEAIEAVTGGGSEFRDTMVIRPWGMDDGAFKNNAKTAFDAEMTRLGRKGPAANFASYGLENFGDAYRVRAGTGYVFDETGRPLTLNVMGPSFAGAGRGVVNPPLMPQ